MINTEKFNSIVEAAKAKAVNDPKWLRAIEKAAKAILSGEIIVTTLAHGALITTEPPRVSRRQFSLSQAATADSSSWR
jgi:hypothetical protein